MQENGQLEEGAKPAGMNNFQARYAIRHSWPGAVQCANPRRGRWGGPWAEVAQQPGFAGGGVKGATKLAFARRGELQLASALVRGAPELGIAAAPPAAAPPAPATPASGAEPPKPAKKKGCGCQTQDGQGSAAAGSLLVALALLWRRRRGAVQ